MDYYPLLSIITMAFISEIKLGQKLRFFIHHLHTTTPLEGFSSEYCYDIWYGKARMATEKDWQL